MARLDFAHMMLYAESSIGGIMKYKYMIVELGNLIRTSVIDEDDWNEIVESYDRNDADSFFTNSNGITTINQEDQIVMRVPIG